MFYNGFLNLYIQKYKPYKLSFAICIVQVVNFAGFHASFAGLSGLGIVFPDRLNVLDIFYGGTEAAKFMCFTL